LFEKRRGRRGFEFTRRRGIALVVLERVDGGRGGPRTSPDGQPSPPHPGIPRRVTLPCCPLPFHRTRRSPQRQRSPGQGESWRPTGTSGSGWSNNKRSAQDANKNSPEKCLDNGVRHNCAPHFVVKADDGYFLLEPKGEGWDRQEDTPAKVEAGIEWCQKVSELTDERWTLCQGSSTRLRAVCGAGISLIGIVLRAVHVNAPCCGFIQPLSASGGKAVRAGGEPPWRARQVEPCGSKRPSRVKGYSQGRGVRVK
jgi:hypothetical protein